MSDSVSNDDANCDGEDMPVEDALKAVAVAAEAVGSSQELTTREDLTAENDKGNNDGEDDDDDDSDDESLVDDDESDDEKESGSSDDDEDDDDDDGQEDDDNDSDSGNIADGMVYQSLTCNIADNYYGHAPAFV